MPSPATCRLASPEEQIAAQHAVIARFETALWEGGFNESLLPSYQSAWRRLETLIAARGDDRRHHFVLVIPVADSPAQPYRPNAANTSDADAAYHDMAGLFGFQNPNDAYRYRCTLEGAPSKPIASPTSHSG